MEQLETYLHEINPERPDIDTIMSLRKHILSRYPDLERSFNVNIPENQTYQNLHTYIRTVNSNIRDLASNAVLNKSIELPYNMLSIYLGRTEELIAKLANDEVERNQPYRAIAQSVISRGPK